jgi:glycosyltransferase involved in cell wall biosynthesis
MKICFGIIVFNSDFVLKQALESVYPFASQILIAEGPVNYWQSQKYKTSVDRTNEILETFPDPDNKIQVVHSQYPEKHEQANAYMKHLNDDIDFIWNLDADEIFKPEDIEKTIEIIKVGSFTSVGFKSLSFYGGFNHFLTGFEENAEFRRIQKVYPGAEWQSHRPPVIKNNGQFTEKHLNYNSLAGYGVRMYHYSYVFPRQVKEKVQYYKAAVSQSNCIDDYFENVYIPWVTGGAGERRDVEKRYQGVHEFIPKYRGDCYPEMFRGEHPEIIKRDMEELQAEFDRQLKIAKEYVLKKQSDPESELVKKGIQWE